jgi:hypothetical protein
MVTNTSENARPRANERINSRTSLDEVMIRQLQVESARIGRAHGIQHD